MDEFDRRLLNRLQHGLPLEPHPYALLAAELDCREEDILRRLDDLLDDGTLTRFGPLFDIEPLGGAFTLAAMSVPEARFEEIAALLAGWPQVAHNYRREHALNMWLVVACDSPAEVAETLARLERESGLAILDLPKEATYHVGLHFPL
ncbi:Lrp/AsnC family transcriptional regulator [Pseudomonas aeruginosa]|uniref:Siroheme decarboxylase NirG subunit n=1 Tax=Pseudomonas aeruginosa TaxID=287 RepID=A0A3M5E2W7_PSEAI|nr:Lrp/AsnC family transcriptional regulator [Pseudomonas aeruginosa]EKU3718418.1 Lrp/AsnC family transcriptional regulator [Pseudomonas aeruginosa]EKW2902622.1 Lrp/AsnC family transcriptional regulator [Pseudomonas aeruginosa]EMC2534765.1 Lrp/AsnC family transcriptional regulator [Pseudomonas aeruginosa]KSE28522.1 protein nirG [Pseudomonas aeruginosa]KSM50918.1 protein nirG [Pseudomonas aeruginosa]